MQIIVIEVTAKESKGVAYDQDQENENVHLDD